MYPYILYIYILLVYIFYFVIISGTFTLKDELPLGVIDHR